MSKTTSPKALQSLLSGHSRLASLARQAPPPSGQPQNDPLSVLPPALRERVTLVETPERWLAMAETSATAQLLRFHLPKLQQALPGQQIKIVVGGKRVNVQSNSHANLQDKPRLDGESARQIRALAEDIDDEGLKASLKRLASRGEDNTP
ncbi:hypothetical protein A11A3_09665 [Alcanivorax hongdengensis A-11-3]|uniref:Uncharacterized protein n=1 Tax=Alcanivorax hongdengensis A-11-3 TaxID=1177179 RepID=L0WDL6_9GAMM|nr:hypothetical protein [Alcanivorax hongdengensis]EKF74257.1 hypothetical protein A11A3_09665 [Alcanivorax hongdengensis A-11-3]